MIRSNQGHFISGDLNLIPIRLPDFLYHGSSSLFVTLIMEKGILKGSRQYVHLSKDKNTALIVAKRHKENPHIFIIRSNDMYNDNYVFYLSKNNVWLTDFVPMQYLM